MRRLTLTQFFIGMLAGFCLLSATAQGQIVVRMATSLGDIDVELYDETAPVTVANFLNYVRDGDYSNSFIHRSAINPLIIQGGGYISQNDTYARVPADPPIVNEYGIDRPNSRGTISMARTSNPDSATSEWFFNIGDNSAVLGPLNSGGYAVFGRVLGSNDDTNTANDGVSMAVVDAIAALQRWNAYGIDPYPYIYSSAWQEIPLIGFSAGQTFVPEQHLVMISQISVISSLVNVTSQAGNAVTLTMPGPATLANVAASDNPSLVDTPDDVTFQEGFFGFQVDGLTPGGSAQVTLQLPAGYTPDTYYMYGPTPDNHNPHWYEFKFDGQTGAEFFGNNFVILHFIDGERGDADFSANGQIANLGAPGIATVITVEALPTVSVAATDVTATEAGLSTGTYTFTRTGSTATALTVNYSVGGTATSGSDYTALGTKVTFPIGARRVTKTLKPIQDILQELNETVVLRLRQSASYMVGTPASATITLTSNDTITRTVTVAATDRIATEAGLTTGIYTFSRTGSTATALTVYYSVGGSATSGSDYIALGTRITFPIGARRVTKNLKPIQDRLKELNETAVLRLRQSPNYAVGRPGSATVTVTSND